jgi:hypothetical protein
MSGRRTRTTTLALLAALAIAPAGGCYRSSAPTGWLPRPEEAPGQAFGSWIELQRSGTPRPVIEGELIAIDADTVHILTYAGLVSLSRASLCCVTLTAFRMDYSALQLWTALGTLSTLSHGFGLILSAPLWLLTGTLATTAASHAPRIQSTDPAALRPYARFPQGMPPGLDRSTLRRKP